jgi:hypothetical protein
LLPDTGGQPRYFRFQISLPPGAEHDKHDRD